MRYEDCLKELLAPLGVYRLDGTVNAAELASVGQALDGVMARLEELHRQADLTTAGDEGLDAVERLFARGPVTADRERRRAALAALLRVGGDSFTPAAINDNLAGCGLNAVASETESPQRVQVRFPEVPGIPEGYEQMRRIIEDILPCHLEVEYVFWYITWAMIQEQFSSWAALEGEGLSWEALEKRVK